MELKKLDQSFYHDNQHIEQALDFDAKSGVWSVGKIRGHGVVKISINDLTFAIPVRSNIKHNASLILQPDTRDRRIKGMGLDYSKALLITNEQHVSDNVFVLKSKAAGRKLVGKEDHITKQFTKYVDKYISAQKNQDDHVLKSFEYRFTTLVNYHPELGIT